MKYIELKEVIKRNILFSKRKEKKFIGDESKLGELENYLFENGFFLVIDSDSNTKGDFLYKNYYYDTEENDLYHDIINKTRNVKIRIREYENGEKFLEIKLKKYHANESITFKKRKKVKKIREKLKQDNIGKLIILDYQKYGYVFHNSYKRRTYINVEKNVRLTVDSEFKAFDKHGENIKLGFDGKIIIERKAGKNENILNMLEENYDLMEKGKFVIISNSLLGE